MDVQIFYGVSRQGGLGKNNNAYASICSAGSKLSLLLVSYVALYVPYFSPVHSRDCILLCCELQLYEFMTRILHLLLARVTTP
jgi:hypothetical protein